MLQGTRVIVETKEQRPDVGAIPVFVPTKAGNDAVALPLVLHLELRALIRSVDAGQRLGDEAIQTGTFKTG